MHTLLINLGNFGKDWLGINWFLVLLIAVAVLFFLMRKKNELHYLNAIFVIVFVAAGVFFAPYVIHYVMS